MKMQMNFGRSYIWTAEKDINLWLIIAGTDTHNLSSCEMKAWKKIQAWTGYSNPFYFPLSLRLRLKQKRARSQHNFED